MLAALATSILGCQDQLTVGRGFGGYVVKVFSPTRYGVWRESPNRIVTVRLLGLTPPKKGSRAHHLGVKFVREVHGFRSPYRDWKRPYDWSMMPTPSEHHVHRIDKDGTLVVTLDIAVPGPDKPDFMYEPAWAPLADKVLEKGLARLNLRELTGKDFAELRVR